MANDALRGNQTRAVTARGNNLVVVAGAGTGKTRVLVERFLSLLEEGIALPALVAITFTEKAAGEMRTRVRDAISARAENTANGERAKWERALRAMDAARIGTIHSLCATLLRANPVEAQVDPRFGVLDETDATIWQADALDAAMTELTERGGAALELFREYKIRDVRETSAQLLKLGNLAQAAFDQLPATREELMAQWRAQSARAQGVALAQLRQDAVWRDALTWLQTNAATDSADKLEATRAAMERAAPQIHSASIQTALRALREIAAQTLTGGSAKNWTDLDVAKATLRTLRERAKQFLQTYDFVFDARDDRAAEMIFCWREFWERAQAQYARRKDAARVLDFNDLETRARALLQNHAAVRERYRSEIASLLVDEFQDTNGAQRDLLYALADLAAPNRLFVVGDGKQSIYGFRGADVTVFQQTLGEITQRWGADAHILLDESFRAHVALVECFNAVFTHVFAVSGERALYQTSYDALRGLRASFARAALLEVIQIPKTVVVQAKEQKLDADAVRAWEAQELAARINELIAQRFQVWDKKAQAYRPARFGDVTLLFRVGSSMPIYEEAFKQANIPYLTYAGTGYFDRPEVRDLIQLLRALDNPADDLALATILHSPLYALSSETLYRLRRAQPTLRDALFKLPDDLTGAERTRAEFAAASLQSLWARVGRVAILDLLRQALAETGYLAAISGLSNGLRRRANVEKLLARARRADSARLSEFNAYLADLTTREAREGDALTEAEDAAQLMTIHRAKGLEFPIVVIPDAGRAPSPPHELMAVNRARGIGVKVHDENGERVTTVGFRLLEQEADARDAQEEKRLLYVAMTRAQEYLIISGSATPHAESYLRQLLDARAALADTEAEWIALVAPRTRFQDLERAPRAPQNISWRAAPAPEMPSVELPRLVAPLAQPAVSQIELWTPTGLEAFVRDRAEFEQRVLEGAPERIIPVRRDVQNARAPAYIVGEIAHRALQRWRFPRNTPNLDTILERYARERGLSDESEIDDAVRQARGILARFARSELFEEMARAPTRYHELPFMISWQGRSVHGAMDAVFTDADGQWRVVDFKTDRLRGEQAEIYTLKRYAVQMALYQEAMRAQFDAPCQVRVCYIRDNQTVVFSQDQLATELTKAIERAGLDF